MRQFAEILFILFCVLLIFRYTWNTWSGIHKWHTCLENQLKSIHGKMSSIPTSSLLVSAWTCLITWLQHLKCSLSPKPSLALLSQTPFFSLSGKMPERCSESRAPLPGLVIWQRAERMQNNWNSIYLSMWHWRRTQHLTYPTEFGGVGGWVMWVGWGDKKKKNQRFLE